MISNFPGVDKCHCDVELILALSLPAGPAVFVLALRAPGGVLIHSDSSSCSWGGDTGGDTSANGCRGLWGQGKGVTRAGTASRQLVPRGDVGFVPQMALVSPGQPCASTCPRLLQGQGEPQPPQCCWVLQPFLPLLPRELSWPGLVQTPGWEQEGRVLSARVELWAVPGPTSQQDAPAVLPEQPPLQHHSTTEHSVSSLRSQLILKGWGMPDLKLECSYIREFIKNGWVHLTRISLLVL